MNNPRDILVDHLNRLVEDATAAITAVEKFNERLHIDPKLPIGMGESRSRFGQLFVEQRGNGGGTPLEWVRRTPLGYRAVCDKKVGQSLSHNHAHMITEWQEMVGQKYLGTQAIVLWFNSDYVPFRLWTPGMEVGKKRDFNREDLMDWAVGKVGKL